MYRKGIAANKVTLLDLKNCIGFTKKYWNDIINMFKERIIFDYPFLSMWIENHTIVLTKNRWLI